MNNMGDTIADALNRITLIETHYEVLSMELSELSENKKINKYINAPIMGEFLKHSLDNLEIWCGIKNALFEIINKSGKVINEQLGGGKRLHLLYGLLVFLMMASFNISQLSTKRYNVESLHETIALKTYNENAGLSVVIPGAQENKIFGLIIPNQIVDDYSKLLSKFSKNTSTLAINIRKNCAHAVSSDPGREHAEFTSQADGTVIAERTKGPTLVTPPIACHSIPSKFFEFNRQTGEIKYVRSEFTLGEIRAIISETATNINNIIKTDIITGDITATRELKNAYNKIVVILNTLDELDKLINLQGIPEIVSDANIIASDRESALQEYLDAIISILKYGSEVTGKADASAYIQIMDAEKKANEEKELAEMRSRISQVGREARQIDSNAIKADRVAYVQNMYAETIDPLATFGTSVLNTTVGATKTIIDATGDVIFAPFAIVDKGLKNLKHFILDNKFILFLALLGVGVVGVISFTIAANGTIRIMTAIKEIILLPIKIPYKIGKWTIKKIFYRNAVVTRSMNDVNNELRQLFSDFKALDKNAPSDVQSDEYHAYLNAKNAIQMKIQDLKVIKKGMEEKLRNASGITRKINRNKKHLTNKKNSKFSKRINTKKRGTKKK